MRNREMWLVSENSSILAKEAPHPVSWPLFGQKIENFLQSLNCVETSSRAQFFIRIPEMWLVLENSSTCARKGPSCLLASCRPERVKNVRLLRLLPCPVFHEESSDRANFWESIDLWSVFESSSISLEKGTASWSFVPDEWKFFQFLRVVFKLSLLLMFSWRLQRCG